MTVGTGDFTITRHTHIVAEPGSAARVVAEDLAAYLRPATGYPLPVASGPGRDRDIRLELGDGPQLNPSQAAEGYVLDAGPHGVNLAAETAHGLFNGIQTIRQLLPAQIESRTKAPGPWTIPSVHIVDYPRYAYRGFMLDIARHFQTPETVKRLIDEASAYKINTLHLHVSDDQGFRIVINGFPNLTEIGSQGSVGTDGRTMDPGGFWTQQDYRGVVAYAAAHFMSVVPEVDSPGHNNAIIMSEYDDTANPLLNGDPQDINCSVHNPPQWNFTGDVGFSAMCPESENSFTIYHAIISQLSAMSTSPYYHVGGDEVPSTVLSQDRYAAFMNAEMPLVTARGKTVMGWAELAGPGTDPPAGSVAEYWNPASGTSPDTATAHEAVAKNMKIVMAPANHAYLDQKYAPNTPPDLGLTWACNDGLRRRPVLQLGPGQLRHRRHRPERHRCRGCDVGRDRAQPQRGAVHGLPAADRPLRGRLDPAGSAGLRRLPASTGRAGTAPDPGRDQLLSDPGGAVGRLSSGSGSSA